MDLLRKLLQEAKELNEQEPEKDKLPPEKTDLPKEEELPPEDLETPEETPDEQTPLDFEKLYLGRREDKHFYVVVEKSEEDEPEDLQVVDQEGNQVFSAKENDIDINNVSEFIKTAIEDTNVDIAQIERSVVMQYLIPPAEEEVMAAEEEDELEPDLDTELEEPEEEVPGEEAPPVKKENPMESKKANEAKMGIDYVHSAKSSMKKASTAMKDKNHEEAIKALEDAADDCADAAKALRKMKRESDAKEATDKEKNESLQEAEEPKFNEREKKAVQQIKNQYLKRLGKNETYDFSLIQTEKGISWEGGTDLPKTKEFRNNYSLHADGKITKNEFANESLQEDEVPGGLADGKSPEDLNPEQLEMGIKVEMEHTDDPAKAKEIAMDHLTEDPEYYTKLKKMENESKADEKCKSKSMKKKVKESDLKETQEVKDSKGNSFSVNLVEEGNKNTVLQINKRDYRFDSEFAHLFGVEEGKLTEQGIQELALETIKHLNETDYAELIGSGKVKESDSLKKGPAVDSKLEKNSPDLGNVNESRFEEMSSESLKKLISWMEGVKPEDYPYGDLISDLKKAKQTYLEYSECKESKMTIQRAVKEGKIKENSELMILGKKGKITKLDESSVTVNVVDDAGASLSVNVQGDANLNVSPEGIMTVTPAPAQNPPQSEIDQTAPAGPLSVDNVPAEGEPGHEEVETPEEEDAEQIVNPEEEEKELGFESKTNEGHGDMVGHTKEVFEVTFEKSGEEKSTRVMAFDEAAAKEMLSKKPGVKVLSAKKISGGKEDKKEECLEAKDTKKTNSTKESKVKKVRLTRKQIEEAEDKGAFGGINAVRSAHKLLGLKESQDIDVISEGDTIQILDRNNMSKVVVVEAVVKKMDENRGYEITGSDIEEDQRWFGNDMYWFIKM